MPSSMVHGPLSGRDVQRVLLYRGRSWISAAIRWQTRSPYSHAALVVPGAWGEPDHILEAVEGKGVIERPWQILDDAAEELVAFVTPVDRRRLLSFARAQVGKAYDWSSVVRFVSRRQAAREAAGVWFCSELVYAAFHHAGIDLLARTEPWEVSPGLLSRSPLLLSPDAAQLLTGDCP